MSKQALSSGQICFSSSSIELVMLRDWCTALLVPIVMP